ERKKLELEEKKLEVDKSIALWTRIPILVTLLVGIITIWVSIWSQRQQAKNAFDVKVAEIIMDSSGPSETLNRAKALSRLFPDRVSEEFTKSFKPSEIGGGISNERKIELLKMLIQDRENRPEILRMWNTIYPSDTWLKALTKELTVVPKKRT